jgi:hypothetical protein
VAGEIRGAFGTLPGMPGGSFPNGVRAGGPEPATPGAVDGWVHGYSLAEPERSSRLVVAGDCPATVAATRTAIGVIGGLLLTLIGAVSYAVLITRETRAVAQAHGDRIDAEHRAIARMELELRELQSRAGR